MSLIFIVEDDTALRRELSCLLAAEGYDVECCRDFPNAVAEALEAEPDCIIMDAMLPGADGRMLCSALRKKSDVCIVMLTCLDSEFDEVTALKLGADDYITKPYRPQVLLAHIQAALRRRGIADKRMLSHAGLTLDIGSGKVSFGDKSTNLTRNEASILALLMRSTGSAISRQELMVELWESDAFIDDNTLTVNVNRLRKALTSIGAPEDYVKTKRGVGYLV